LSWGCSPGGAWVSRFAVLYERSSHGPPRLIFFTSDSTEQLAEEISLRQPLEVSAVPTSDACGCAPAFGSLLRLSSGGGPPLEFALSSEEERLSWIWALGESACQRSQPVPAGAPPLPKSWAGLSADGSGGLMGHVAEQYAMGKILLAGEDYMVVEGIHQRTHASHALKLVCKSSRAELKPARDAGHGAGACWQQLSHCVGDVFEMPSHVCMVMPWGTHELDSQHGLAALVLEALRVLHELLPSAAAPKGELHLCAEDARRLISRLLQLDLHLQANLFLDS
jgi:hypothetical protein